MIGERQYDDRQTRRNKKRGCEIGATTDPTVAEVGKGHGAGRTHHAIAAITSAVKQAPASARGMAVRRGGGAIGAPDIGRSATASGRSA